MLFFFLKKKKNAENVIQPLRLRYFILWFYDSFLIAILTVFQRIVESILMAFGKRARNTCSSVGIPRVPCALGNVLT